MKTNEIDKIIADALEADQQSQSKRRNRRTSVDAKATIRKVLNIIFMLGFITAVVIYFAMPEQRILFFGIGFGALFIKLIEFFIRFLL